MAFFFSAGGNVLFLWEPQNLTFHLLLQGLCAENPLYLPNVGLQGGKKLSSLNCFWGGIKKTALQDVYSVPDPRGQACRAWQGRMFVCVLDEAAVFKSRWPMMSLEKNPETCYKKELFYGSQCNVPILWAQDEEKRNWKTFPLLMVLRNCPLGLQGDEGLKERKGLGEKRGKKQEIKEAELILSPLYCLCILAPGNYHTGTQFLFIYWLPC